MWLLVGLLVMVAGGVSLVLIGREGDWEGERRGAARVRIQGDASKLTNVRVGIELPSTLDFELRRELWFDRWAKAMGLAVEQQLRRERFDRAIYLVSDETRVRALLLGKPVLADRMAGIPEGWLASFNFQRLVCRNGEMYVDLVRPGARSPSAHIDALIDEATRRLQALAAELPDERGLPPRRDRVFLRATLVLGVAGGLATNGVLQLTRMAFTYMPYMPDTGRLHALALPISVVTLLVLLTGTMWLVGRTSRAHYVLLQVLLIGGFGAYLSAYGLVHDANTSLDREERVELDMTVTGRHRVHHRRHTNYYLYVRSASGGVPLPLAVSAFDHYRHSPGAHLRLRDHAGYFGVRWFEFAI